MGYVCVFVCFKTLYGGQFTLPTQLKIPSYRDRAEGGAGGARRVRREWPSGQSADLPWVGLGGFLIHVHV